MDINEILERLETLESKLSFQDHTIEELDAVIIRQQQQIEHLELQHKHLAEQMSEVTESSAGENDGHEPPPHY